MKTMKVYGIYEDIKKQRADEFWQRHGIHACVLNMEGENGVYTLDFEPGNMTRYHFVVAKLPGNGGWLFSVTNLQRVSRVCPIAPTMECASPPDPQYVQEKTGFGEVDALMFSEFVYWWFNSFHAR